MPRITSIKTSATWLAIQPPKVRAKPASNPITRPPARPRTEIHRVILAPSIRSGMAGQMALQSNCIIRSCYRVESRGNPPPKYGLPPSLCRKTVVMSPELRLAKCVLIILVQCRTIFYKFRYRYHCRAAFSAHRSLSHAARRCLSGRRYRSFALPVIRLPL